MSSIHRSSSNSDGNLSVMLILKKGAEWAGKEPGGGGGGRGEVVG